MKNLVECEKIDSRYIGTLIAKISYEMITVTTQGACSERDAKSIFTQLKKNYEQLKSISPSITDEEEALYEFLEESDIYATLVLVFDSLNDSVRRDYVTKLLNAKEIYSKDTNGNLLSYAIKTEKTDMIDDIISNADNLDVRFAISEVFQRKNHYAITLGEYSTTVDFQRENEEYSKINNYYNEKKNAELATIKGWPAYLGFGIGAAALFGGFFAGF